MNINLSQAGDVVAVQLSADEMNRVNSTNRETRLALVSEVSTTAQRFVDDNRAKLDEWWAVDVFDANGKRLHSNTGLFDSFGTGAR